MAVRDGRLYALGGSATRFKRDASKTVERYDAERNVWEAVADMSTERYACAAAVLEGKLFVMGGFNAQGHLLSSVEYYEPASNEWKQVAPMNKARCVHAAAVWNGRLYVMGGWGADSSVEWYDLERNEWIKEEEEAFTRHFPVTKAMPFHNLTIPTVSTRYICHVCACVCMRAHAYM